MKSIRNSEKYEMIYRNRYYFFLSAKKKKKKKKKMKNFLNFRGNTVYRGDLPTILSIIYDTDF